MRACILMLDSLCLFVIFLDSFCAIAIYFIRFVDSRQNVSILSCLRVFVMPSLCEFYLSVHFVSYHRSTCAVYLCSVDTYFCKLIIKLIIYLLLVLFYMYAKILIITFFGKGVQ